MSLQQKFYEACKNTKKRKRYPETNVFAILSILRRWLTLAWEKCEPFTNMVFIFIFIEVSLGTCVFLQTGYSLLQMWSFLDVCEKLELGPAARTTAVRLVRSHVRKQPLIQPMHSIIMTLFSSLHRHFESLTTR